jgi:hypothetical protein
MKNLYLLGGIAIILIVGIGVWLAGRNTAQAPTIQNVSTTTTAQLPTGAPASTKTTVTTGTTPTKPVPVKTIAPAPKISSFEPPAATVSSNVTIIGTGFDTSRNAILFGTSGGRHHPDGSPDNQIAVIASPDGKTLSFTVPNSGPSGLLCDANNHCVGISALRIIPGQYPVVVSNRYGVSKSALFTVVAQ